VVKLNRLDIFTICNLGVGYLGTRNLANSAEVPSITLRYLVTNTILEWAQWTPPSSHAPNTNPRSRKKSRRLRRGWYKGVPDRIPTGGEAMPLGGWAWERYTTAMLTAVQIASAGKVTSFFR